MSDWSNEDREAFYREAMERWHSRPGRSPERRGYSDAEIAKGALQAVVAVYLFLICACVVALVVMGLS